MSWYRSEKFQNTWRTLRYVHCIIFEHWFVDFESMVAVFSILLLVSTVKKWKLTSSYQIPQLRLLDMIHHLIRSELIILHQFAPSPLDPTHLYKPLRTPFIVFVVVCCRCQLVFPQMLFLCSRHSSPFENFKLSSLSNDYYDSLLHCHHDWFHLSLQPLLTVFAPRRIPVAIMWLNIDKNTHP